MTSCDPLGWLEHIISCSNEPCTHGLTPHNDKIINILQEKLPEMLCQTICIIKKPLFFSTFWTPKMVMNKWIVQLSRTIWAADMVRPLKMIKTWICHKFWILYQLSPTKSPLENETALNKNPSANQHKRSNYMRTSTNKNKHYKEPRSSNQSVKKS